MKAERWGVYRNPKKSETCLVWGSFITVTAGSSGALGGVLLFFTNFDVLNGFEFRKWWFKKKFEMVPSEND